jgi:hypothetical protein
MEPFDPAGAGRPPPMGLGDRRSETAGVLAKTSGPSDR